MDALPPQKEAFAALFDRYSAEEASLLAHIKRMRECLIADPDFRAHLEDHIDTPQITADAYGLKVDMDACRPLYDLHYHDSRGAERAARWPQAALWDAHAARVDAFKKARQDRGSTKAHHPAFDCWREAQIARLKDEVGFIAKDITHPIAAIELSNGCSVGCWFCGISADRFKGPWPLHAENAATWRGMLEIMAKHFGESAVRQSLCFWGTDPLDNPDYPAFIEIFEEVLGGVPHSTTAVPLRDLALTKRMLETVERSKTELVRFSVLTLKLHRRIHKSFNAEELFRVELLPQFKESLTTLAVAGRARENARIDQHKSDSYRTPEGDPIDLDKYDTIACVTGFLIRPAQGTIELVSPTRSTPDLPNGYHIYGRRSFSDLAGFDAALTDLVNAVTDAKAQRPDHAKTGMAAAISG